MFRRKTADRKPAARVTHLYHGIAIEPGERYCAAVTKIQGKRFLSDDAPRLPLEDCDCLPHCRCVYRHYADRRTEVRRDSDLGLPQRDVPDDQRAGRGRRVTDS